MHRFIWLSLIAFLLCTCSSTQQQFPKQSKLVVYLIIDQLPAELFQRLESEFTGGFRWLLDHGIDFRNAHHEHANAVTSAGHFVLSTGLHPGAAGVLGNSWYLRELGTTINCVEDSLAKSIGGVAEARSYRQINATAIGDWMKGQDSRSKVFTIAGKDRAAVFMGGKRADLAVYYDYQGAFMTSDYYVSELPDWLADFNQQLNFTKYRDSVWTHSAPAVFYEKYGTVDDFSGEVDQFNPEPYSPTLPIFFNDQTDSEINRLICYTPWFEQEMLDLAITMMRSEKLGQDNVVDLLGVGVSTADWIGHSYGPHSHEILDYYLRLDQYLDKFFKQLNEFVGLDHVNFVLISDHGVCPLPEYLAHMGITAGRLDRDRFEASIASINAQTNQEVVYHNGGFYFPRSYTPEQELQAIAVIRKEFAELTAIDTLLRREDILAMSSDSKDTRRLRNMIHPTASPDIIMVMKEYYIQKSKYGTTHGTHYDYDTHIPVIFAHQSIKPQRVNRPISSVDVAPTIARLVGVDVPTIDGKVLPEIQ